MKILLSGVIGYFIGNLLFAYILGKTIKKVDIRKYGSNNPGSTNALRVFGIKLGAAALALDMIKGIVAVLVGQAIAGYYGMLAAAIGVVIGHNWPIFLNFKGGKGVATSAGVILVIDWRIFLIILSVFVIVFLSTKIVSLSSICAASAAGIAVFFFADEIAMRLTFLFLAICVVCRHKDNIIRLARGEEKPIISKKGEENEK